jgi:hypothetical protein
MVQYTAVCYTCVQLYQVHTGRQPYCRHTDCAWTLCTISRFDLSEFANLAEFVVFSLGDRIHSSGGCQDSSPGLLRSPAIPARNLCKKYESGLRGWKRQIRPDLQIRTGRIWKSCTLVVLLVLLKTLPLRMMMLNLDTVPCIRDAVPTKFSLTSYLQ